MICGAWLVIRNLLGDFEDSQKSEGSENRETKWSWFEGGPDNLEDGTADDDAVEPIEGRFEIDSGTQRVHFDEHLRHEQRQKGKFSVVYPTIEPINNILLFQPLIMLSLGYYINLFIESFESFEE